MNYYDPTEEEQKILNDFEGENLRRVPDFAERKQDLQKYAKNTLNKTKNINIRLSERHLGGQSGAYNSNSLNLH